MKARTFREAYGHTPDEVLAERFGMTVEEVQAWAKQFALAKDKKLFPGRDMPRWTDEQVAILVEMHANHTNEEIALRIGRSLKGVVAKAHALGLKKTLEHVKATGRRNNRFYSSTKDTLPIPDVQSECELH